MFLRLSLCIALVALARPCMWAEIEVPPGFAVETLAQGLNAATAMAPAPDGRIFIADQFGPLMVWKEGRVLGTPALDLSGRVDSYWERGFIGVTLHPEFPRQPYIYVMYVAKEPYTHHVISRFTLRGDVADPESEFVLLKGDDQARFKGSHPHGHQGGPLRFGPDGRLYASIGEQTAGRPAQQLDAVVGKILRFNADGSIPSDNPFFTQAEGKYRAIYAIGLRNVFGLAFLPGTNRLFATDVGQTSWEEVNEILPGVNYGWPDVEGMGAMHGKTNPRHAYPAAIGRSIVGATFAQKNTGGGQPFPPRWHRQLFFADWAANWIKTMNVDEPYNVTNFARNLNGPVAVEFAPDNSLLVLERGTIWNDRKKLVSHSGSLVRIRYTGDVVASQSAASPPARISEAGVFRDVAKRELLPGFERFELTAPLWLSGLNVQRWISVPASEAITVGPDGQLALPAGTRVVQHFELEGGVPFETHIYWFTETKPRASAYRWSRDGVEAELITETSLDPLPGDASRRWHSPAPETELDLAMTVSGFVLQLTVAQLNRDVPTPALPVFDGRAARGKVINQLLLWSRRGWLAKPIFAKDIPRLPRMAPLEATEAPLELRVRSYLDANCAMCHQPDGPSRASFDARVDRPLHEAGLLNAEPIAGDMGVAGARVVVPGVPEKSLLLLRLRDNGPFRMPPIRLSDEPPPVLPALDEWIRSLGNEGR